MMENRKNRIWRIARIESECVHHLRKSTKPKTNSAQYNVLNFGAKPDGETDSTNAFLAAWTQACGSNQPATVFVPPGRFFLRNVVFQGPCKNNAILVRVDGTLVAPSDYQVIGNAGNWIFFQYVNGVTVSGGVLDGQGPSLWAVHAPTPMAFMYNYQVVSRSSTPGLELVMIVSQSVLEPLTCGLKNSMWPWPWNQESGVNISDVTYQDIHGTSATQVAVKFDCSKKNPCTGIKLEDVKLTYMNQPADASCNNADGNASGFVQPSSCL
ncbi:hypothetical protein GH714_012047 [Hevea brasiliensis]|uniref:Rhamnogalacturonase A/B/Epimerase-like pectate lyase domain-containing protein n=1 Tax=Hevea brasiliensis TaxID=3981 RepID=A0A6A6LPJ1_HEVBR|nr:hypothetical protein GH714_012047 [Hevea brasiliensis]